MKKVYKMEDLDCAHCAAKMEKAIMKLDAIEDVAISFLSQKMTVTFKDGADVDATMKEIAAVCRKIEPDCRVIIA